MREEIITVAWHDGAVRLIDQTRLPVELVYLDCRDIETLAEAIEMLRVRGAPAIGVAAGYGMALAAQISGATNPAGLRSDLQAAYERLKRTRPTAVNLFWALDRQNAVIAGYTGDAAGLRAKLLEAAHAILNEDRAANEAMAHFGAELVPPGARILTHCNAGALATSGVYGTALGVIRAAAEAGKVARVYADETRPLLQGARLTAWELERLGIPVTVQCDNMAGWLMRNGGLDCVITGADRIAANGDAANKIGTYSVAVLARQHGIPFYIAAPWSTFDLSLSTGQDIPIEERRADEVRCFAGVPTAPREVAVYNPAFDVTPNELIAAIITDRGVARAPYTESLRRLAEA